MIEVFMKILFMIPLRILQAIKFGPVAGLQVISQQKICDYIRNGIRNLHSKMILYDSVRKQG